MAWKVNLAMSREPVLRDPELVIRDLAMIAVLESARQVAPHKAAVLITGETGTDKELVAQLIHRYSLRCSKPWVDLNCAALPEHLVESELFGYEKGAFSGAEGTKRGLFESADGGTIFLDEIGELEPKVQVKLLRVLDTSSYYRLGGNHKVTVDVRVVAATNRDLSAAVRAGTFRRDLYHRISEIHIHIPPLRERPEDIVALAEHFLALHGVEAKFTPEALTYMQQMEWPGNVRELRNVVRKLGISLPHDEIRVQDLLKHVCQPEEADALCPPVRDGKITPMSQLERAAILRALEATGGNQSLAALRLGMPRRTFCRKLNAYKISFGRRSRSASRRSIEPQSPHFRTELNVPVRVQSRDGRSFLAETRDLSTGGLGVQNLGSSFNNGDELMLEFHLPDFGQTISAKGVLAWSQPGGAAGIRFTDIGPENSEMLNRWIANRPQISLPSVGEHFDTPEDRAFLVV